MSLISCDYCGKECSKGKGTKRFCSDVCRWLSWKDRKAFPCFYCGMPANTIDHIPPRSARPYLDKARYPHSEVRACKECNCLLGARAIFTPPKRKKFIKRVLRWRYRKDLQSITWTDNQVAELGRGLRSVVEARIVKYQIILSRLRW